MPAMTQLADSAKPARKARQHGPRHEGKRDTILRTAARLFSERGFEATSLDAIADELDMHKATLYHYISSKQEVLYQCLVQSFADLDEVIVAVQDQGRPVTQRLRHFALALARAQNNEYGRCMAIVGPRPLNGNPGDKIREFQRKLDSTVRGLVKEGVASGELRQVVDPALLTAMLFGTLNWVPNWYRAEGRLTLDEIVDRFVDMLVHGIEAVRTVDAAPPAHPAKPKTAAKTPAKARVPAKAPARARTKG
jgi:AcrR family transcriptional regulator